MTEEIGSDKHKRPSSAEIEVAERMAVMKERLAQASKRDEQIISQNDIIIEKLSKIQSDLRVGEEKFRNLESWKIDTTTQLEAVENRVTELVRRVDAVEPNKPGMFGSIVGSLGFVGMGLWWGLHLLSKGAIPPPPGDK